MWKDFLFFSKGERNGLLVLASLLLLMFAVNFCLPTQATMPNEVALIKEQTDSLLTGEEDTSLAFLKDTNQYTGNWHSNNYDKPKGKNFSSAKREWQKKEGRSSASQSFKNREYDKLMIELNTADTTTLKQLRGIGSKLSQRIVKYRKKIGGFSHKEQLKDIYGLSEETYLHILPHVWVDTTARITKASSKSE
ncbi:MAG: helix-hairpin-helix domain-containing protein [Paludibacteraceae bacterium]|nr:helix-hairpin-helix domain-containing protein [Paludibacteraceae bacterium]MBP5482509.1 helix-hairpin-helix domain-containing protein [Paludibacteraceae bacterium]